MTPELLEKVRQGELDKVKEMLEDALKRLKK
jgi:hypothetical protein